MLHYSSICISLRCCTLIQVMPRSHDLHIIQYFTTSPSPSLFTLPTPLRPRPQRPKHPDPPPLINNILHSAPLPPPRRIPLNDLPVILQVWGRSHASGARCASAAQSRRFKPKGMFGECLEIEHLAHFCLFRRSCSIYYIGGHDII